MLRLLLRPWAAALAAGLVCAAAHGASEPVEAPPAGLASVPGWIVFDSKRDDQFDIFKMRPDGSRVTRLTDTPESETNPDWSPDGTRIVFQRKETGDDNSMSSIHIMDADGSDERMLVKRGSAPAFTPDGTGIIFDRDRVSLHYYSLRSGNQGPVPPNAAASFAHYMVKPRLSPDAATVLFTSDKGGRWHAWALDMDGKEKLLGKGCEPFWHPDGKRVFFISDLAYQRNAVWLYPWPDGPGEKFLELDGTYSHVYFPSISDDGRFLLFSACPWSEHDHSQANYQVFIMDLRGGQPVRLSHNEFTERWPRLSTVAR